MKPRIEDAAGIRPLSSASLQIQNHIKMTVEDTIQIDAPNGLVWDVTEDVERWPEWTPTVTRVHRIDDGPFGIGSSARIKQPGQPESVWTVTDYVRGERFAWASRRTGLRMTASHQLHEDELGTSNTLRLEATGMVAVVFWPLLRPVIRRALIKENRGLKARCESLTAV